MQFSRLRTFGMLKNLKFFHCLLLKCVNTCSASRTHSRGISELPYLLPADMQVLNFIWNTNSYIPCMCDYVKLNPNIMYDCNALMKTTTKKIQTTTETPVLHSHTACLCIAVDGVYLYTLSVCGGHVYISGGLRGFCSCFSFKFDF